MTSSPASSSACCPRCAPAGPDPWKTLKDTVGSIAGAGGSLFLRKGLVTAQVALSFLLLFGAGLFMRSLQNLRGTDTGVAELDNLITFQVDPGLSGYDEERATNSRASSSIAFAPCPASIGRRRRGPRARRQRVGQHDVRRGPQGGRRRGHAGVHERVVARLFRGDAHPDAGRPRLREHGSCQQVEAGRRRGDGPHVAIVNRRFAEHFFKSVNIVGKHIGWGDGPKTKLNIEIVGVVENALYQGPREGVRRQVFVPRTGNGGVALYVRSGIGSTALYGQLRSAVRQIDTAMPVFEMKTVERSSTRRCRPIGWSPCCQRRSACSPHCSPRSDSMASWRSSWRGAARSWASAGARRDPACVVWMVMREVLILLAIGLAVGVPSASCSASPSRRSSMACSRTIRSSPAAPDPAAGGGVCPRRLHPRPPRRPHQPDPRAALRVAGGRLRSPRAFRTTRTPESWFRNRPRAGGRELAVQVAEAMMPLWKFQRSSFSFGACAFSSGRPTPKSTRRQAELLLERRDHRNRAAFAIEDRRACRSPARWRGRRPARRDCRSRHPRLAAVHAGELQLHRLRRDLLDVGLEQLRDLVRILIRHQPHADLRHRDGRNHGLGAFAGEAGEQAVDLEASAAPTTRSSVV